MYKTNLKARHTFGPIPTRLKQELRRKKTRKIMDIDQYSPNIPHHKKATGGLNVSHNLGRITEVKLTAVTVGSSCTVQH